jgi:hypothetical protein
MPLLHQMLTERIDWYDNVLQQQAEHYGYGYVGQSTIALVKHLSRDGTSRIALLADRMGVTRRRVAQIVGEAVAGHIGNG